MAASGTCAVLIGFAFGASPAPRPGDRHRVGRDDHRGLGPVLGRRLGAGAAGHRGVGPVPADRRGVPVHVDHDRRSSACWRRRTGRRGRWPSGCSRSVRSPGSWRCGGCGLDPRRCTWRTVIDDASVAGPGSMPWSRVRRTSWPPGGASMRARSSMSAARSACGRRRIGRPRRGPAGAITDALAAIVDELTEEDLRRPGGEEDWNVAQAIGHACESRAGLSLAAAKAAAGTFPADAPVVVPGVPGPPDADRGASSTTRSARASASSSEPDGPSPAMSWIGAHWCTRSWDDCAAASGCSSPACTT